MAAVIAALSLAWHPLHRTPCNALPLRHTRHARWLVLNLVIDWFSLIVTVYYLPSICSVSVGFCRRHSSACDWVTTCSPSHRVQYGSSVMTSPLHIGHFSIGHFSI